MNERAIEIICGKCGSKDSVIICENPEDEIDMIACSMSESLLKDPVCDTCKNKARAAWLKRTQVFEVTEDEFKIPKKHQEYKKELASEEGRLLGKKILENSESHMYISGSYDLGKSKACCACLVYLKSKKGKKVYYIGFNELINRYSTLAKDESKMKADDFLKSLLKCDYLVIDDFCKKRLTYSNCEATFQLSEYIYSYDHNCVVWITANHGYQKILKDKWECQDMGSATFSRFLRCGFKEWNGKDFK